MSAATHPDLDAPRWLHAALPDIRRLLAADCAPLEFFEKLLTSLTANDGDAIAGVWMAGTKQQHAMGLLTHLRFLETGVMNDRRGALANQALLIEGWKSDGPILRPHGLGVAIPAPYALLIPLRDAGQKIGILQLFLAAKIDLKDPATAASLDELTDLIERYLRRAGEASKVADTGPFLGEFESFLRKLHATLDPAEVMLTAAHELRPILHCDRVSFLEVRRGRPVLRATSGQKSVNPRSRQVQLIQTLSRGVVRSGRRFQYTGQDETLPADVSRSLSEYIEISSAQVVLIEPVLAVETRNSTGSNQARPPRVIGAVVCEYFTESLPHPALATRLGPCVEQIALAYGNARRYRRLRMVPGIRMLGWLTETLRGSRLALAIIAAVLLGLGVQHLATATAPLRIDCRGHLMPAVRREVYAPLDGEVAEVLVRESEPVQAGQVLARLSSTQIGNSILERTSRLQERMKTRDATRAEMRTSMGAQAREQSARLQAQMEVLTHEIETIRRQLAFDEAERDKLVIRAPIAGTITTPDPEKSLQGRPVQRGETLLTIMDESGPWQIELDVPEKRAGHLLRWIETHPDVPVEYRLVPRPEVRHVGQVTKIGDRTVLSAEHGTAVPVQCSLGTEDLPLRRIGTEVSARLDCGERSLLFVYFGEFEEWLRREWWL